MTLIGSQGEMMEKKIIRRLQILLVANFVLAAYVNSTYAFHKDNPFAGAFTNKATGIIIYAGLAFVLVYGIGQRKTDPLSKKWISYATFGVLITQIFFILTVYIIRLNLTTNRENLTILLGGEFFVVILNILAWLSYNKWLRGRI